MAAIVARKTKIAVIMIAIGQSHGNIHISTQASSVYDRLQADILSGKLRPGLKLRLKELIEMYETGNSPLREALNRLSANGMVVRE